MQSWNLRQYRPPRFWHKRPWFRFILQIRGSVLPAVLPRTILCGLFGELITVVYTLGWPVALPVLAGVIPNIVLGLLLVFRTNTAYERFWEGRKLWGSLINTVRNLARQIWVIVAEKDSHDRETKKAALHLLVAFAVATKLHLREERVNEELANLIPIDCYAKLKTVNNPPLSVAFWISDYLQQQYYRRCLNIDQLNTMQNLVDDMVEALGGCERILRTPMPLAYAIHLKQLLLIYCLTLPFQFVSELSWWTGPIVALVSFTLFGIEEIGLEIENPFGHDPNDLPLDTICATILRNIDDLTTLEPNSAVSWLSPTDGSLDDH
ncbi:bestrophin family protein [Trichothermofontia sp.]